MVWCRALRNISSASRKDHIIDGKPSVESVEDLPSLGRESRRSLSKMLSCTLLRMMPAAMTWLHMYDTTYEVIRRVKTRWWWDIDDSIVRGTTLEKSILKMPLTAGKKLYGGIKRPSITFPIVTAYRHGASWASLLPSELWFNCWKHCGKDYLLGEVYESCLRSQNTGEVINHVNRLYHEFTPDEISDKMDSRWPEDECRAAK